MAEASAVDTNVLVAAHVIDHEHHALSKDVAADATHVLGQVAVECWSVLRRHFRLPVDSVATMLNSYLEARSLVAPADTAYRQALRTGRALGLAGNIHDAVIVRTAEHSNLRLTTLDAGLHRLADGVIGCDLLTTDVDP